MAISKLRQYRNRESAQSFVASGGFPYSLSAGRMLKWSVERVAFGRPSPHF